MNKEKTQKAVEVMLAYVDGKAIDFRRAQWPRGDWEPCLHAPHWDWYELEYRVAIKESAPALDIKAIKFVGYNTFSAIHHVTAYNPSENKLYFQGTWFDIAYLSKNNFSYSYDGITFYNF